MMQGKYNPKMEDDANMSPILDSKGDVKDFRYMLPKEDKKNILSLDRRVSHVVGRTVASIFDKAQTSTFLKVVIVVSFFRSCELPGPLVPINSPNSANSLSQAPTPYPQDGISVIPQKCDPRSVVRITPVARS